MCVQRIVFAPPTEWVDPELYFRIEGDGGVVRNAERTCAQLGPYTSVRTDTYFGRLRASYWQRWTAVPAVTLRAQVDPGVRMQACIEDIGGHVIIEGSAFVPEDADGPQEISVDVPLERFADGGAIHAVFTAGQSGGMVRDARYTVAAECLRRDIPTDIVICTFNRPVDCARTVATLADDIEALERIRTVRVVDQGDRHPADESEFQRAQDILGDRINVVHQPNLGGAGGFSRGMLDATEAGECLVLLTDDDIRPEPETTLRLSAIGCFTEKPMLFGAQMLFLNNPTHLFRQGERFDWAELTAVSNDPMYAKVDTDARENQQLRRLGVDYNAWWSCLVPSAVIDDIGLALPLFFQFDDIDYGFRAAAAGYPTETIPGAAVWHADFYWKDVDNPGAYFTARNSLVASSAHSPMSGRQLATELGKRIMYSLVSMRYGMAWSTLEGVRDFLKGPLILEAGSEGDIVRIAKERNRFSDTRMLPMTDMPAGLSPVRPPTRSINSEAKTLAKRVAFTQIGKARPGPVAISFEDNFWWHISTFDEAWVTDASQNGVRHLVRDRALESSMYREAAQVLRELHSRWDDISAVWCEATPDLVATDNWRRLFAAE